MHKKTPLFETHVGLGARMVEFGGWQMPIQYAGILEEHRAVRAAAGVFDISHMGEVLVRGRGAEAFLNATLTNDLRKLAPGAGQYTLLCNERGGVIDDLFAYRLGPEDYLLIINASRIEADVVWLTARLAASPDRAEVRMEDASARLSALAVQGPKAASFVDAVAVGSAGGARPSMLKRNQVMALEFAGAPAWVARTGYTGEDGFEWVVPNAQVKALWDRVLAAGAPAGIRPCGLGARDTLRTEMGYPLYGQDLTEEVTPIEAGLDVFVALDKPEFPGRTTMEAQKREGRRRRLAAFRMTAHGAPPPRPHYAVWSADAEAVRLGETTSGTLSPSLGVGIGMAYLPVASAEPGTRIDVEIRGRRYAAEVARKPLFAPPKPATKPI